jgi:hypothetical protein
MYTCVHKLKLGVDYGIGRNRPLADSKQATVPGTVFGLAGFGNRADQDGIEDSSTLPASAYPPRWGRLFEQFRFAIPSQRIDFIRDKSCLVCKNHQHNQQ